MILPEDIYATIAKVDKIKLNLLKDPRPGYQKELADKVINDVLFVLKELKAKL